MTGIPERSDEQLERAIPARLLKRLMQGRFESGDDVAVVRRFVGLTRADFARAIGISEHTLHNWEQGLLMEVAFVLKRLLRPRGRTSTPAFFR